MFISLYFAYCFMYIACIPFGILFFFWLVGSPKRQERRRQRDIAEYIESGDYKRDMERIHNECIAKGL